MAIKHEIKIRAAKSNWSAKPTIHGMTLTKRVGYTNATMSYNEREDYLIVEICQHNHNRPYLNMEVAELSITRVNQFFNHIDNMIHRFITYYTKEDFYNE